MIYAIGIVALQIFCGVHCVKRGKTCTWLFLILLFPLIGSLVYFVAEILPEWQGNGPGHIRRYNPVSSPGRYRPSPKELKRLQDEVRFSNTVQNRENLADEYARQSLFTEAVAVYRECLSGPLENDPALLFKLAEAAYGQGDHALAIASLNRIRATSDYRPAKVRLLLARSYEAAGQADKAEAAYDQALKAHNDLETKCRFAIFLQAQGEAERAAALLDEIRLAGERMPDHARKLNRVWLDLARKQARLATQPSEAAPASSGPQGEPA